MSEEFKQERKKISFEDFARQIEERTEEEELPNPSRSAFENVQSFQKEVAQESGKNFSDTPLASGSGLKMQGNAPPEFLEMIKNKGMKPAAPKKESSTRRPMMSTPNGEDLNNLLEILQKSTQYEAIELPSKGKFYDNIPGIIHIRPMTGEEEQTLATQRLVRQGKAIDKIFQKCIQENISVDELLAEDRTYLLIYLRGISYTPEYDVEIKCPECEQKFSSVINLDDLNVESCPDDLSQEDLHGTLPVTGFKYSYRMPTGVDEAEVSRHKDSRIKMFGDPEDDTLLYRTAVLLNNIESVTDKKELLHLLKKMPIRDVSYLRNKINNKKFGVDTTIPIICSSCSAEFEIELPLEASFFFPREKEEETRP
jgi:hypothetical protein